jgi:hypothetical protein
MRRSTVLSLPLQLVFHVECRYVECHDAECRGAVQMGHKERGLYDLSGTNFETCLPQNCLPNSFCLMLAKWCYCMHQNDAQHNTRKCYAQHKDITALDSEFFNTECRLLLL